MRAPAGSRATTSSPSAMIARIQGTSGSGVAAAMARSGCGTGGGRRRCSQASSARRSVGPQRASPASARSSSTPARSSTGRPRPAGIAASSPSRAGTTSPGGSRKGEVSGNGAGILPGWAGGPRRRGRGWARQPASAVTPAATQHGAPVRSSVYFPCATPRRPMPPALRPARLLHGSDAPVARKG